jgi:hypothetical protein
VQLLKNRSAEFDLPIQTAKVEQFLRKYMGFLARTVNPPKVILLRGSVSDVHGPVESNLLKNPSPAPFLQKAALRPGDYQLTQ